MLAEHIDRLDREVAELQSQRDQALEKLWRYVCCHHDQMPKDLQFDCAHTQECGK